jgi:hypothetical protein
MSAPLRFDPRGVSVTTLSRYVARRGKLEVMDWYAVNGGNREAFPPPT